MLSLQHVTVTHPWRPLIAALVLWSLGAWAETPKLDLRPAQAKLETALVEASLPALRQYAVELAALEKEAVEARDYDTAIPVREERLRIEAQITRQQKLQLLLQAGTDSPQDDAGVIRLPLKSAKLDRVRFDEAAGVLTDWSAAGASATWQLPGLPAGGYEVVLHFTAGADEGGTVLVQESFHTLTAELKPAAKPDPGQNLGTLRVRDGAGQLRISAKLLTKTNLMRLQSVELLPANR